MNDAAGTVTALVYGGFRDNAARANVALVGTGDRRWELLYPPSLPFVCLDSQRLGTVAAGILNDVIDGKGDIYSDSVTKIAVSFVDATHRADAVSTWE